VKTRAFTLLCPKRQTKSMTCRRAIALAGIGTRLDRERYVAAATLSKKRSGAKT
jgi:hypothetical protein